MCGIGSSSSTLRSRRCRGDYKQDRAGRSVSDIVESVIHIRTPERVDLVDRDRGESRVILCKTRSHRQHFRQSFYPL
jgi:hypothetical protein